MSLGLPTHLAPQSIGRAFAKASHVVACVCLLCALAITTAIQAAQPESILWPAMFALVPMAILLWQLDRQATVLATVAYLLVGAACVYWYTVTFLSQYADLGQTDNFVMSVTKLALVMVGGAGLGMLSRICWAVLGYALAEVASFLAALQTGAQFRIGFTALTGLAVVVVGLGLIAVRTRSSRRALPSIHRAAQDEQLAAIRYRIELQAAAVLHDTVLNHLSAIASAPVGPINREFGEVIERDLRVLVGEEWLTALPPQPSLNLGEDWQKSELYEAVRETQRLGLEVEVSGDLTAVARLEWEQSVAVGLAVKQCLVNVLKHAGTERAELVIYGSEGDVSFMIIDSGRGFSVEDTGLDRLGLRQSVHRRIEAVGGKVQVWSTPGRGTSVMITIPVTEDVERGDAE